MHTAKSGKKRPSRSPMNIGPPQKNKPAGEHLSRNRLLRIERRESGLWAIAVVITGLLTAGLASFLAPPLHSNETWEAHITLQQAIWGLVGMVQLFDLYSIYQQLQIHRIRRQLFESQELFRLIMYLTDAHLSEGMGC
jgi:hypothetical protein